MRLSSRRNHLDIVNDIAKIKNAFADTAHSVKTKTSRAINERIDEVRDRVDNVAKYTSKHPVKALSTAMFTGLLVGYVIRFIRR